MKEEGEEERKKNEEVKDERTEEKEVKGKKRGLFKTMGEAKALSKYNYLLLFFAVFIRKQSKHSNALSKTDEHSVSLYLSTARKTGRCAPLSPAHRNHSVSSIFICP